MTEYKSDENKLATFWESKKKTKDGKTYYTGKTVKDMKAGEWVTLFPYAFEVAEGKNKPSFTLVKSIRKQ